MSTSEPPDGQKPRHHAFDPTPPPDAVDRAWSEKPATIRAFLNLYPQYEQLGSEIAYILSKRLKEMGIEHAAITCRAKTLKSFINKLEEKKYSDPLTEITDFAGVRVVYLYKADRPQIERVIEAEFEVLEKIDKVEQRAEDQFGYGALHYLVHLGRKSSGARYDDLQGLVCEVQVRTVLQDAWAIIDHHLVYKRRAGVPKPLRRKLSALAGMFETADDQFDVIRQERETYREAVAEQLADTRAYLDQPIDLDTLEEFARSRFPQLEPASGPDHLSTIFDDWTNLGYQRLREIDRTLKRTEAANKELDKRYRPATFGLGEIARALALLHPIYRNDGWDDSDLRAFNMVEGSVAQE